MLERKKTRQVRVGSLSIGGDAPITIQSMLNVRADDLAGSVRQAVELEAAGCEILRAAIPNPEAIPLIGAIKRAVSIPLVADIHFDYRLALAAAAEGIDKIRINPGNIGEDSRVRQVADCCRLHGIPIRIGVNSGSVEKQILARYGGPTAQALVESAMYHVHLLQKHDFDDIVISLKASNVPTMVEAYRLMSERCDYPLHLGVTEAGTERMGLIKSTAGIASLLLDGIGDTIRVSLTADPVREIGAARDILRSIGLRQSGVDVISCPTCGRTKIDVISLAGRVEEMLRNYPQPLKVAVMGCAVNGPGEAREADIGIAGGDGEGLLFCHGNILRKVKEDELLDALREELEQMVKR